MKDRFTYEECIEHKLMMWCTVLMFTLSTRLVGLNQILNIYRFEVNPNPLRKTA